MRKSVVVVGMGHVGLPLACLLAKEGFVVHGIDVNKSRVLAINEGRNPLKGDEPGLAELLEEMVFIKRLSVTVSAGPITESDAVFVCVDTPMTKNMEPDLHPLTSAIVSIGRNLRSGTLISIESTIPPGTMTNLIQPMLEKESGLVPGQDFYLVHCPERVMPGRLLSNMRNCQRVLGGINEDSMKEAKRYYSKLVQAEIHETDMLSAEITKTVENAYRDVQIAFANEVALACEELGADAYEIRELVNTSPFRDMHIPGSGVGGHCVPKDPWLLVSSVGPGLMRLLPTARSINDDMPHHLAEMAREALDEKGIGVKGAKVTIMGIGFLRDSGDIRNSPSLSVIDEFVESSNVIVHDPYAVEAYRTPLTQDIDEAIRDSDCAIFVTDHTMYESLDPKHIADLMRNGIIVDGRNIFNEETCIKAGLHYRGIGKGR